MTTSFYQFSARLLLEGSVNSASSERNKVWDEMKDG